MNRYQAALEAQGFEDPTDESPFENPDGWCDGSVHQTGGMVMVRRWFTAEDVGAVLEEAPDRETEFEVAYGENPGVSLQRYEWDGDMMHFMFDGVVETVEVGENTDAAKAEAARELMESFER